MSAKTFLVIDIGSNTVQAEIFSQHPLRKIWSEGALLKLGRYLTGDNVLPPEAVILLQDALLRFVEEGGKRGVADCLIFATSILRRCANAKDVVCTLQRNIGVTIDVVSEADEGLLAFESAQACCPVHNQRILVMDMGGGSCECVSGQNGRVDKNSSWPVGLSVIKKKFDIGNVVEKTTEDALNTYFYGLCVEMRSAFPGFYGSIVFTSSVAKMLFLIAHPERTIDDGQPMELMSSDFQQKFPLPEWALDKKDLLRIGTLFLDNVLHVFGQKKILVSPWSIRESYLQRKLIKSPGALRHPL